MILCDAAQTAEGKLYILGGGWSMIGPDPSPISVAMKIDLDWSEIDRPHHWELFLLDEDGKPVFVQTPEGEQPLEVRADFEVQRNALETPGAPAGAAYALNFGPMPLATGTRYTWRLTVDGLSEESWSLDFSTRPAASE
jgi:hypothetical protein